MQSVLTTAAGVILLSFAAASCATPVWDRQPDTWEATDGLGRTVIRGGEAPAPRDRTVVIFYFLWMGEHGQSGPWNISKILAEHPGALDNPSSPPWGPENSFHHWGEPLFGYYLSDDKWVYRKHAQMLADAGVDAVVFDCTNQFSYPKSYLALCEAWSEVRSLGNPTPQIAFLCPFGDPSKVVKEVYETLYRPGRFRDLWFQWKGKPLILADPAFFDGEIREFFTFRKPIPSYFSGPPGPDQWGWLEVYPQHVFRNSEGEAEMMTVGVAQNAQNAQRLAAMSEPNAAGRSWHGGRKDTRPGAVNLGLNFAEQWERALEVDPQLVFITGWNEWVALRLNSFAGVDLPVMFVDQFNQEYSRDIEPMRGGHGDHYYYQMVDFIRRYKGARPAPPAGPEKTIRIDGRFDDWRDVTPEYRDDIGDTAHRDHPGWGDAGPYVDTTGRNDIVAAKVARDAENLYFYVRARQPLTPRTDSEWMLLFIDADGRPRTGWEGFDFVVNRVPPGTRTATLERSRGRRWEWEKAGEVSYRVSGREMELAIPRRLLGLQNGRKVDIRFKWADNCQLTGDPIAFTEHGDAAPNGRFTYRYTERQ